MPACLICLGDAPPDSDDGAYHRACLVRLFGVEQLPRLDLDPVTLPDRVRETHDRMSVSGVQRKALMRLSEDKRELLLGNHESMYILKPRSERFDNLPENEHVSMVIAGLAGLEVPPLGLLRMSDDSLAYVIKRFDRTDDRPPQKLSQEDFCQLAEKAPEDKEKGTAEECAGLVQRFTVDPEGSLRRLFRLFVVCYWLGNGDLHLKNISLAERDLGRGTYTLSPAYDLICSQVYRERHDPQLLSVSGRTRDLSRSHYVRFGAGYCGMSEAEADAELDHILSVMPQALEVLGRSPLPDKLRKKLGAALRGRAKALAPIPRHPSR